MERDRRLGGWSFDGLGASSQTTEAWVQGFLLFKLDTALPPYLLEAFDRAKACIVYGCYHYPLLTLGIEELFRFQESALREAAKEAEASKVVQKKKYAELIDWAWQHGYLKDDEKDRWHAGRSLRNSTSHKSGTMLLGPNDATRTLETTVDLTKALFARARSTQR